MSNVHSYEVNDDFPEEGKNESGRKAKPMPRKVSGLTAAVAAAALALSGCNTARMKYEGVYDDGKSGRTTHITLAGEPKSPYYIGLVLREPEAIFDVDLSHKGMNRLGINPLIGLFNELNVGPKLSDDEETRIRNFSHKPADHQGFSATEIRDITSIIEKCYEGRPITHMDTLSPNPYGSGEDLEIEHRTYESQLANRFWRSILLDTIGRYLIPELDKSQKDILSRYEKLKPELDRWEAVDPKGDPVVDGLKRENLGKGHEIQQEFEWTNTQLRALGAMAIPMADRGMVLFKALQAGLPPNISIK
jgi:hypothetical protein